MTSREGWKNQTWHRTQSDSLPFTRSASSWDIFASHTILCDRATKSEWHFHNETLLCAVCRLHWINFSQSRRFSAYALHKLRVTHKPGFGFASAAVYANWIEIKCQVGLKRFRFQFLFRKCEFTFCTLCLFLCKIVTRWSWIVIIDFCVRQGRKTFEAILGIKRL